MQPDPSWQEKDFYSLLGVSKEATEAELKSAYRRKSKELHPDTNGGDEAAFKALAEAYSVLKDPEKRRAYDRLRSLPKNPGFGFSTASAYDGFDLTDLSFDGLFGDFGSTRRTVYEASPVRADAKVSFDEAAQGCSIDMIGSDGSPFRVAIPAGVEAGSVLRVPGAGGQKRDLLLTIEVENHRWFTRRGLDLHLELPVTFDELALGATVEAPTYPSGTVRVRIPAGSPNGRVLRVAGKGITNGKGETGDLLLTLKIEVPKSLPPEAIAAVDAYRRATTLHTPRAGFSA